MKIILTYIFIVSCIFCHPDGCLHAQARIVLNSNPYLIIQDSGYVVIDNPAPNALMTIGSGGKVISEGEQNYIRWNIDTMKGTYIIPYANHSDVKIPFTMRIDSGNTGHGHLLFSTYTDTTWDNEEYMPSDVTNMNGNCCVNNSFFVIDRFWIADARNYTRKPSVNMTFTYDDAEWMATGNAITESNLFAQRFNPVLQTWGDWYGTQGTNNPTNNTVQSGSMYSSGFFRSWTLVDGASPLPIELAYFRGGCEKDNIVLYWATSVQINNDYFTIERSSDAQHWEVVGIVTGAGNSLQTLEYTFTDNAIAGTEVWYYRLKQTDYDGSSKYFNVVFAGCDFSKDQISIYPNPAHGQFYYVIGAAQDMPVSLSIYNMLGQIVMTQHIKAHKGISTYTVDVSMLASGSYNIEISTGSGLRKTQKQFIFN